MMKRTLCTAVIAAMSVVWCMKTAQAENLPRKSKQAEALNAEGKKLVSRLDLDGAAERFRDAWQLVRDPRYAFNLCYTLEKSGKLRQARAACQEVASAEDKRLVTKAKDLLKTIEKKLAAEPAPVPPVAPPPANGSPAPTPAQPPPQPITNRPPPGYTGGAYPPQGYPQVGYLVPPQRTTISYFSHVLIADGVSWSLLLASAGAESDEALGLGIAGLLIGGPVVHLFHGNSRGAWLSTGARLGMPLGGALIFAGSCEGDCYASAVGGAIAGYAGALLLDWFVFAKKEKIFYPTQGLAQPTLQIKDGGAVAGISFQL